MDAETFYTVQSLVRGVSHFVGGSAGCQAFCWKGCAVSAILLEGVRGVSHAIVGMIVPSMTGWCLGGKFIWKWVV